MRRSRHNSILLLLIAAAACVCPIADAHEWSISLDNVADTFNATTGAGHSVSGGLNRPSTGFLKMTVTGAGGGNIPALGSVKWALEVPNLVYVSEPLLTDENQLIYTVADGACPTENRDLIFVFGHWDLAGSNDLTNNGQPAFGSATYATSTDTFTITNVYNITNSAQIAGFSSFDLVGGGCASGETTISGSGDRGGKLYFGPDGATFFKTNGRKSVIGVPRTTISGQHNLNGGYAVYRYDSAVTATLKQMRLTVTGLGDSLAANQVDPETGGDLGSNETLAITQLNSPANGLFRATLTNNGDTGKVVCAVYFTSRNVLFCVGQSPEDNTKPFNMMMVGDMPQFSRGGGVSNNVLKMLPVGDGSSDFYMGGDFLSIDVTNVSYITRLNTDGSVDSAFTSGGFSNGVTDIFKEAGGDLYVAGKFDYYANNSQNYLIRLNSDGTKDAAFNIGSGFNTYTTSVAVGGDGDVYVVGGFTSFGGAAAIGIARLNSDGSRDTTLDASTGFTGADFWGRRPWKILPDNQSNDLYIVGNYNEYRGNTRQGILRVNPDGTLDNGFAVGTAAGNEDWSDVRTAAVQADGKLVVAGWLDEYDGVGHSTRIYRINTDGTLDTSFNASTAQTTLNGIGSIELLTGGKMLIGGISWGPYLLRLNTDGTLDSTFDFTPSLGNRSVNGTYTTSSGSIMVGGNFESVGDSAYPARYLIRVSSTGTWDTSFGSTQGGTSGWIDDIAPSADGVGDIWLMGDMHDYRGTKQMHVVRVNPTGVVDLSFNTSGNDFGGETLSIGVANDGSGGIVIVNPTTYPETVTNYPRIIRFHKDGQVDTTFNPGTGADGIVNFIRPAVDGLGDFYVSGSFADYNGTTVNGLVRINSNGSRDAGFDVGTGFNGGVRRFALTTDGSHDVYAVGDFTTYKGVAASGIVRVNSDGSRDAGFAVGTGFEYFGGMPFNYSVALARDGSGDVYVGGDFNEYDGATIPQALARLNSNGTLDAGFALAGDGFTGSYYVYALAVADDNKLYAAGLLEALNYVAIPKNLVRFNTDGSRDTTFDIGDGTGDAWGGEIFSLYVPNDGSGDVYAAGEFSIFHGQAIDRIVRLNSDGSVD